MFSFSPNVVWGEVNKNVDYLISRNNAMPKFTNCARLPRPEIAYKARLVDASSPISSNKDEKCA